MEPAAFIRIINRFLDPIRRRLRLLAVRAVLLLADDSMKVQHVQGEALSGETMSSRERFQHYGFTSVPLEGAEMIGIAIGGVRGHTVFIADDDGRYRKKDLLPGDTAIYTSQGVFIWLQDQAKTVKVQAGTEVDVTAPTVKVVASAKVTLDTPSTECTGNLKVDGNIEVDGTSDLKGAVTAEAGANVTGNLGVTGTATADSMAAASSLKIAGKEMGGHTHKVPGAAAGGVTLNSNGPT